jgi:citrate synthase
MNSKIKRLPWISKTTEVSHNNLRTNGYDQSDIIREFSYEEMVFLMLLQHRPLPSEANTLRAVIVSYVSHGITPNSTLVAMLAADCGASVLSGVIAGFLVGAGSKHLGALDSAMELFVSLGDKPPEEVESYILRELDEGRKIPGYGHRIHSRDPRVKDVFAVAMSEGCMGKYTEVAKHVEKVLSDAKRISLNIDGAAAGILLDLGFHPAMAAIFPLLGRAPMHMAAYFERVMSKPAEYPVIEINDIVELR